MQMSIDRDVHRLDRPGGRLAFTDAGTGPLVVAVPGMGDLRAVYDGLVADLTAHGFRVIVLDVRGHGDSDTGFRDYGDDVTAADVVALLESVGEPAVLVGNSFAGSAAVLAAADRPDLVRGLVLVSPFLRDRSSAAKRAVQRVLFGAMFARPWGAAFWTRYYAGPLNRGRRPADLDARLAAIAASMREPARLAALRRLAMGLDHTIAEPRLEAVTQPALIAVGALDPDYADPAAELAWMGEALHAETLLVPDAAHYAHAQRPDVVLPEVDRFLGDLRDGDGWRARA
jgi:pimeloyl-ACP methyl ester carboxylesterase